MDLAEEVFQFHNDTQMMQKQTMQDYLEIETQFLEQEKHIYNIKGMKNLKELNLIKQSLLY